MKAIKRRINQGSALKGSYFLLFSLAIMMIYTSSSTLYVTNPWVDSNSFMTMGRGIWYGLVPYRDLFEQKGPILYFMHTIGYLLSPGQFWGVYVLQSFAMTINIIYFYKTARLFLAERIAFTLSFFVPVMILNTYFHYGNSAEEFALPAIFILLYTIFKTKRQEEFSFSNKELFAQGALLSYVFWIKYSLIGGWVAFILFYAGYLLIKKEFTKLWHGLLFGIGGFLSVSLPILIYFAINRALFYLFDVYFVINMTTYAQGGTPFIRLFEAIRILLEVYRNYLFVSLITIIGLGILIYTKRLVKDKKIQAMLLLVFLGTGMLQYYGGIAFHYYFLIMTPFISLGIWGIAKLLADKKLIFPEQWTRSTLWLTLASAFILPLSGNNNITHSHLFPQNDYIQIEHWQNTSPNSGLTAQQYFAQIINEVPNATLLNYGFLDGGFYLAANILPSNRFMMINNIPHWSFPQMWNEQTAIIAQQQVDFVVVRISIDDEIPERGRFYPDQVNFNLLNEYYELVAAHAQLLEGWEIMYLLYQVNSN